MPRCSFCKRDYPIFKGVSLVMNDGNTKFLCGAKCFKNFHMKRDPRKVNWIRKLHLSTSETAETTSESDQDKVKILHTSAGGSKPKKK